MTTKIWISSEVEKFCVSDQTEQPSTPYAYLQEPQYVEAACSYYSKIGPLEALLGPEDLNTLIGKSNKQRKG